MDEPRLLNTLKKYDPEVYQKLQQELQQQHLSLSLEAAKNPESPLVTYLESSVLANNSVAYASIKECGPFEKLVLARTQALFQAEHAIVRLHGTASAGRVVLEGLLRPGDTILSFNGHKKTGCLDLHYSFAAFSINSQSRKVDEAAYEEKIKRLQPRLVILSPLNYPLPLDYEKLAAIAHQAGAYVWISLAQNAGLIASGLLPSPVPYADVVTFPTHDSLHGPEGAILLCKRKLAPILEKIVFEHGYTSLQKNHLAALAFTLKESAGDAAKAYFTQVCQNAAALGEALTAQGLPLFYGKESTQHTHLVIVSLPRTLTAAAAVQKLRQAGLLVNADILLPEDQSQPLHTLRLSTLNPTSRSLKEWQMNLIAADIARALRSDTEAQLLDIREQVGVLVMDKPIFSEEWLPITKNGQENPLAVPDSSAAKKRRFWQHLFHH